MDNFFKSVLMMSWSDCDCPSSIVFSVLCVSGLVPCLFSLSACGFLGPDLSCQSTGTPLIHRQAPVAYTAQSQAAQKKIIYDKNLR